MERLRLLASLGSKNARRRSPYQPADSRPNPPAVQGNSVGAWTGGEPRMALALALEG
jgi:hypothetical protein